MSLDTARILGFQESELKAKDREKIPLAIDASIAESDSVENLLAEGRALEGYRNLLTIRIAGNPRPIDAVPFAVCEENVQAVLGREVLFNKAYFGLSARLLGWNECPFQVGELKVWDSSQLMFPITETAPDARVKMKLGETERDDCFLFDSGSDYSVYPKASAKEMGIEFCAPRYERPVTTVLHRVAKSDAGHIVRDLQLSGPLEEVEFDLAGKEFRAWTLFYDSPDFRMTPVLGCASTLEHFFVGFGAGPTIFYPLEKLL